MNASTLPDAQRHLLREKQLVVELYVLQTNTNTDGRVESRDNEHRTMKNKCCTISPKKKKQTHETEAHENRCVVARRYIKCWHSPPRKTPFPSTLDAQSLNKTHRTQHLWQFIEEMGSSNHMCVPTTSFTICAADKTDNRKRGANTNAVA